MHFGQYKVRIIFVTYLLLCITSNYFVSIGTTKVGTLPNSLSLRCKSETFGTEFENIVDGMPGAMNWLELQEGKTKNGQ